MRPPRIVIIEHLFEIEEIGKITGTVVILLHQDPLFDHREYHAAHIFRFVDPPVLEHGPRERTISAQRQFSHSLGEFPTGDVPWLFEGPNN